MKTRIIKIKDRYIVQKRDWFLCFFEWVGLDCYHWSYAGCLTWWDFDHQYKYCGFYALEKAQAFRLRLKEPAPPKFTIIET